jgi:FtsZ-binding cell division protein ZapB
LNNARVNLKKWQSAASNCSTKIEAEANREVDQKAVADAKKIRKAEDDLSVTQTDMDALRRENQELKQQMKEYQKRVTSLEGTGSSKTSVMGKEVEECNKEKKSLQEDKEGLVKTVQHLLKANGTETLSQSLQKEVLTLQRAQLETEKTYGRKVEDLREKLKTSEANAQDVKEVAQTMNEQNADLRKDNANLQSKLDECQADSKDLEDDKKQLVISLQGTLRQNTEYQAQMAKEEIKRAENPKKYQPAKKKSETATNVLKGPGTSKDDEVKVMGETKAIDHYIAQTTVEEPAAEIVAAPVPEEPVPEEKAESKQEERKPVMPSTGPEQSKLAKYLKADEDIPPVKREPTPAEKVQQESEADDNIGNDVGKLLSQAEDAVNNAQVENDDQSTSDEDASDAQTLSDAAVLLQKSG